jgi:hypothetical protein
VPGVTVESVKVVVVNRVELRDVNPDVLVTEDGQVPDRRHAV